MSSCPAGFYEDMKEGVCAPCHSDCELCHGPGSDDCDSCADPESTLRSGTCVSACPSQTYKDGRSGECMSEYEALSYTYLFMFKYNIIQYKYLEARTTVRAAFLF